MSFAGFDTARYPGDEAMQWLWNETNLYWVGLYLAVGGGGLVDKKTWQGRYATVRGIGWGVAPIYVGKQRGSPKLAKRRGKEREEGYSDGEEACMLASNEGIPRLSVIYFDFEGGDKPTQQWMDYFAGWVDATLDRFYMPGLYCSYLNATFIVSELAKRVIRPWASPEVWAIKYKLGIGKVFPGVPRKYPDDAPGGSGYSDATLWQLGGDCWTAWEKTLRNGKKQRVSIKIDLNSSSYGDPGLCRAPLTFDLEG